MGITSNLAPFFQRAQIELSKNLVRAAMQAGEVAVGAVRREVVDWTSNTSARKTGALARSFHAVFRSASSDKISVGAFSALPYARIHDEGGTIRPKKGRFLTIPNTRKAERVRARNFPEKLVFLHWPPRLPVLATIAANGKIKVQYTLVRSARITPKHYLKKAAERARGPVLKIFAEAFRRSLEG